jgi:hypothetical protein
MNSPRHVLALIALAALGACTGDKPLDEVTESEGRARRVFFVAGEKTLAGLQCAGDGTHTLDVFAVLGIQPKEISVQKGRLLADGQEQPSDLALQLDAERFIATGVELNTPASRPAGLRGDIAVTDALAKALHPGARASVTYGSTRRTLVFAQDDAKFLSELTGFCNGR